MNRNRTWRVGEMSLALLVSLGVGSWAWGQCSNDAGAGDLAEGEACLTDEDQDTINGGCNSSPPAFFTLASGDFIGGVVDLCGSASNYRRSAECDVDADCLDDNCQGDPNPGDGIAQGTCVGPNEPLWVYRDLDTYLIPQSVLMDHDTDGNGVVRITSEFLNAEFDATTHLIGLSDPGGTCGYTFLSDDGCWDTTLPQNTNPAADLLIIADFPDGVLVLAAPGTCQGDAIWEGYECSTGENDYILRITLSEAPTACQPGPPQGPCNEPNPASPGCADPACCDLVCQQPPLEFCCALWWTEPCVVAAVDLGCAGAPPVPGQIATGDDSTADGYLRVMPDSYGAWAKPSFGGPDGGSDLFNPPGADFDAEIVTYASGFFFFISGANQRELLADNTEWQADFGYGDDASLDREIISPNVADDTDGDGVADQLVSQFRVWGTGVDLTFDLTQSVESGQGVHGAAATLTQTYEITNNLPTPVTFSLLRQHDGDLPWSGYHYRNAVGTGYHGNTADLYVFIQDVYNFVDLKAMPGAAICLSSPSATAYVGSKLDAVPDPDDPDCPPYGAGLSSQYWDHYGIPDCWRNHIAYIGHDINGSSSGLPFGDVHAALGFDVMLPDGPDATVAVEIMYTYGQQEPLGQENAPCPWDCIATGDDPDADGYLRVKSDPLGSFWVPDWDGPFEGDLYNPAGPLEARPLVGAGALYLFRQQAQQREFLITCPLWATDLTDESLLREITAANVSGDTDGDGVDDQMVSQFQVTGTNVDLTFDLTQRVERTGVGAVSVLTQDYVITNNLPTPVTFSLQRHYDSILRWVGSWVDDVVGTGTNDNQQLDRFVFLQEAGKPATAVTVSSPGGTAYVGAKMDVQPRPGCQPYGWGTDYDDWDNYGMPACWRNHIANVGYDLDGTSGASPGSDAHLSLEVPVWQLAPGASTTVRFTHTYGQTAPLAASCPWDCQDLQNGAVDVADFLALLGQWGQVGTSCDFDGGGVSVTDFLEFLANFGPCP